MIYCSIKDFNKYSTVVSDELINKITEITPESFKPGRIVIKGDEQFLNLFSYETKSRNDAVLEAHKKYIDVMYVVEGEENVYVKNAKDASITKEYDEKDDYLLLSLDEDASTVRLYPGMLLLLFPEDAHAPGCNTDTVKSVKKIVGKVMI